MNRNTLHSRQAEYEKTLYRRSTRKVYCYMLDRLVLILGKDRAPEDIFRSDMPGLRQKLREEFNVKSPKSMANYMEVGRSFYNWMDANEYVPIGYNPFRVWVPLRSTHKGQKRVELDLVAK